MLDYALLVSFFIALIWLLTVCLPWLPWATREVLEVNTEDYIDTDISDITVVIPARNEADVIKQTLSALTKQGIGLKIILVDDESDDGTAEFAKELNLANLQIINSQALPAGWTGKLWAQQQGVEAVSTSNILLLDADIQLLPGIIVSLLNKQQAENLDFVSLMAELHFTSFWEKLLMPAFIYFFKMLYPFALANKPESKMAAAAGGCILVKAECLRTVDAMRCIKDAIIDDCTLAKSIKSAGYKTWIGLTHAVMSQRPYASLQEIWDMVARTAFSQLFYSLILLLACTAIMLLMYIVPVLGLMFFQGDAFYLNVLAVCIMVSAYMPTLRFYAINRLWAFTMPLIASLYILMTWTSALRYWRGERSRWKGRIYEHN